MSGQIKRIIDDILKQMAKGDPILTRTTKIKLILKGINPDKFTPSSQDDPIIIQKLLVLAKEFNIRINYLEE